MPETLDHVAYLSQEIGPRPAGTEEEQQAALYITEQLQKEANLSTSIEDFNSAGDAELPALICSGASVLATLLSLVVPSLGIVWFVVALIAAGLFIAELLDKPILSRVLSRGVSQNIVAQYNPGSEGETGKTRKRKVIIVTHYDSGKVQPELNAGIVGLYGIVRRVSLGGMAALPFLILIKTAAQNSGAISGLFSILAVVAMIVSAVPLVVGALHMAGSYNEGANSNASGVAALLEVARRVGTGKGNEISEGAIDDVSIHGGVAAEKAGVIPEGAFVQYEDELSGRNNLNTNEDSGLAAAKAAVVAITGKPVSGMTQSDVERNLEQLRHHDQEEERAKEEAQQKQARAMREMVGKVQERRSDNDASMNEQADSSPTGFNDGNATSASLAGEPHVVEQMPDQLKNDFELITNSESDDQIVEKTEPSPVVEKPAVPEWFRVAQEKAKKHVGSAKPVQRSRYASALDSAVQESAGHFAAANRATENRASEYDAKPAEEIREVKAPLWENSPQGQNQSIKVGETTAPSQTEASVSRETGEVFHVKHDAEPEASTTANALKRIENGASADLGELNGLGDAERFMASENKGASPSAKREIEPALRDAEPGVGKLADDKAIALSDATISAEATAALPARTSQSADRTQILEASSVEPKSRTQAFNPIDVSSLNLDDVPPVGEIAMPAFLNAVESSKTGVSKTAVGEVIERSSARVVDQNGKATCVVEEDKTVVRASNNQDSRAAEEEGFVEAETAQPNPFAPLPGSDGPVVVTPVETSGEPILSKVKSSDALATPPAVGKQRAPLADVENAGKSAAKSLLSMLPSITSDDAEREVKENKAVSNDGVSRPSAASNELLRNQLPSLSGALERADANAGKTSNVSTAGAFSATGATTAFSPVGDELIENVDPDEIYVDDADDSAYEEEFTETGAFAGAGYVEMPKSRFRKFLDRFRRPEHEDDVDTPQDWLDVDETEDARTIGAKRQNWESFQPTNESNGFDADGVGNNENEGLHTLTEDAQDPDATVAFTPHQSSSYDDVPNNASQADQIHRADEDAARRAAHAGAHASTADNQRKYADDAYDGTRSSYDYNDERLEYQEEDFDQTDDGRQSSGHKMFRRFWHGGAYSPRRMESAETDSESISAEAAASAEYHEAVQNEVNQVYQFRNPDISTEVWFVALGSQIGQNNGVKAFLAQHEEELRGSFVVEIDSLGAGKLCLIDREGFPKPVKASSRMKRYVRKASQVTGVSVGNASLLWNESAASFMAKHGVQSIHLSGIETAKPAKMGDPDDVLDGVDGKTLEANVGFIMELLKNM